MQLYRIDWEEVGGDEYTELVAAYDLTQAQAIAYAVRRVALRDPYTDESDIVSVTYENVATVKNTGGEVYLIRLEKL